VAKNAKRTKGQAAQTPETTPDAEQDVPSPAELAESLGMDPSIWPTAADVEAARAEGAPWLEELGRPDIDETEQSQVDRLSVAAEGQDPDSADAEPGEDEIPELPPVPASPTEELTHDPDPRLRESARVAEARYEADREPPRPEGEARHMGGPLYWLEVRGQGGQGFTRGVHTVELPPGPWRGFQAIPLDTEDNLVLAGHVVTHHLGQSAQLHVQGASGWAPVVALVLVRDERAHVQAEALG
jgi:hypothetical protein